MRAVAAQSLQAASSVLPVLISGETGTGKDLVARVLHAESARRDRPLVAIACASLSEELVEAELFGYVRGAFSGAERDHDGLGCEAFIPCGA